MSKTCARWIATLCLAGVTALANADAFGVQGRLLAEPLWLLQDGEGTIEPVWFELREGSLLAVSCTGRPGCWRPASVSGQRLRVEGFREFMTVWPDASGTSLVLVPAWVVPSSSTSAGH